MDRLRTRLQGANSGPIDARVWIASVHAEGLYEEGRGANREAAISDLIERLVDRIGDLQKLVAR